MPLYLDIGIPDGRSSGEIWLPTELDSEFWFRADTALTDEDGIYSWTDKTGNGNHATQATGSKKPDVVEDVLNGEPVAQFDGDDFLTVPSFSGGALSRPFTYWGVWRHTGGVVTQIYYDALSLATQATCYKSGTISRMTAGAGPLGISSLILNTWYYWINTFNSTASVQRRSGTENTGNTGTKIPTGTEIGIWYDEATSPLTGQIAEFGLIRGGVTGTDLTNLEGYMTGRYNL
jgi:hypothetical protein